MPRKPKPPPEPKKHSRGWHQGSIVEVRPGRWRAFRARTPDGARPSRTFPSREQAERWAQGDPEPDVLYVGAWLERWLSLRLPTVRPNTRRNYRRAVLLCAPLAAVPLAELTPERCQAHANALLGRYARSSVMIWRSVISGALNGAVPRHLPANPLRGVRLGRAAERPVKAWTAREVAALIAAARGRAHETWLWLSLGTGLRIGEALALEWPDVDLAGRTVRVSRAADRTTGEIGPTKSGRSRVVDLPDELVPVLVAQRARQRPSERRVCTSAASGRVPPYSTVHTWLLRLCREAGVSVLPCHSTRHSYATLALEAGVPLKEVSEALGHADAAITASVYSHALPERRRRAANALGAVLAPENGERLPGMLPRNTLTR